MMWLHCVLRKRTGQLALVLVVGLIVIGAFGSWLAPYNPLDAAGEPLAAASAAHWFGTDNLGRDVLSRILAGAGISLLGGVLVSVVAFFVGTIPGILSVYLGRVFEWASLRLMDTVIALPFLIVAVAVTALLGNGLIPALVVVGILVSPIFYRVARSVALSSVTADYVLAARLYGASTYWVVSRHILPKLIPALAVTFANTVASGLIVISSLSFLGIGVQPPAPTWGGILAETLGHISRQPLGPIYPSVFIIAAVWAFHALADLLRDSEVERVPADTAAAPGGDFDSAPLSVVGKGKV
ncbi:ABC transporter permease [Mycobacterium sp. NPDC003449]